MKQHPLFVPFCVFFPFPSASHTSVASCRLSHGTRRECCIRRYATSFVVCAVFSRRLTVGFPCVVLRTRFFQKLVVLSNTHLYNRGTPILSCACTVLVDVSFVSCESCLLTCSAQVLVQTEPHIKKCSQPCVQPHTLLNRLVMSAIGERKGNIRCKKKYERDE